MTSDPHFLQFTEILKIHENELSAAGGLAGMGRVSRRIHERKCENRIESNPPRWRYNENAPPREMP
jgi:hypothetical protein